MLHYNELNYLIQEFFYMNSAFMLARKYVMFKYYFTLKFLYRRTICRTGNKHIQVQGDEVLTILLV